MVGYKFSKNDWVTPFLVIFRSVREILLVTVFLEHPVAYKEIGIFCTLSNGHDHEEAFQYWLDQAGIALLLGTS